MKEQTQEQQMISMMKRPIPKKKVGIIKLKMIREGTALYGTKQFRESREAAEMVRPIFEYADREMLVVMSLDTALTPIAMEIVAVGSVNACWVEMREIFKHAVLSNAAKIICFHNHPSGNLTASQEDCLLTAKIKTAGELMGIELIDHIIIGMNQEYISFQESGIYPFGDWKGAA